ncbi:MAG: lipopolysaccharide heptosyltransferase I [Nitrospirota bacterium]|jgi:heptosyltransferase-1
MRVLIVKVSALGDVVHALPALHFLRRQRPDVHVTWVVEQRVAGVLAGQEAIDEVIPIDTYAWRSWLRRGRVAAVVEEVWTARRRLRSPGFDLVLDLQGNIKSGVVAGLARARRKVGLPRHICREPQNTWFVGEQAEVCGSHVVDQAGEVVAHALGTEWVAPVGPVLEVASRAIAAMAARLGAHHGPRVAFIHGASSWNKQWPAASFTALGRHLAQEAGAQIILPWDDADGRRRAEEIAGALGPVAVVARSRSLAELAALLAACDLAIGGDTGPSHMAWAVGTPTVTLYGPNPSARNGPRGGYHRVLQSPVMCSPCWGRPALVTRNLRERVPMVVAPGWPTSPSPQAALRAVEGSDEEEVRRRGQPRERSSFIVRGAGTGCPTGDFICMEAIGVGEVAAAAERLLQGVRRSRRLEAVR